MPAHLVAEEGPLRGLILNLEEGDFWTLGRDPVHSTFVLEDESIAKRAAEINRGPDGISIENLSRTKPIFVNDDPISEKRVLNEGDKVQIGHTVFRFSVEEIPEDLQKPKEGYDEIFSALNEVEKPAPKKKAKPEAENPYDTIFDDSSAEAPEELPFNIMSSTPYLLKVISGPNAGAEIGIEKGRTYTLGKNPDVCDIVFQDMSVSRNHARLTVSPDGAMEIEDLASKNGTVVNGVPVTEKRPITPQDMIALGTTVFLIIDREAPQETIYAPALSVFEMPRGEEAAQAEKKDWKKVPIPGRYLAACSAFVAVFFILFVSFFSLFKTEPVEEVAKKEPASKIEKALAKFEGVQFSFNPASGKLFLVGHVTSAVDAEEMRFRIGEIPFVLIVEDNVVIDEIVDKTMNDVLSMNPDFKGVSIQSPSPGKFVAKGYVETNAIAVELSDTLTVNFPYLDKLDNEVVVGEVLVVQIDNILKKDGFGTLTFQYLNGEIVLSGNYSQKNTSKMKSMIKELDALKGIHGVKNYAIATSPNAAAIDISSQFKITGIADHEGKGFSAVINGKIYELHDSVSGLTITEIDPTMILLEKDGIKYKINYSR